MLKNLTIWNFALIEHVSIDFQNGLNILTGETGAGKSILIDALGVILGGKTPTDSIRRGAEWLRVEAVFDADDTPQIRKFLDGYSIVCEDGDLLVSRQLSRSGKNAVAINGCHATLTTLKKLGELLVDLHGQHENQALLRQESAFSLVDEADRRIAPVLRDYRILFKKWHELTQCLAAKEQEVLRQSQMQDMLRWQIEEIETAGLTAGEEERLAAELKILSNAEKISSQINRAYQLLDGNGRGIAALSALAEAEKCLENVCRYDKRLENAAKLLADAVCQLEECNLEIRGYGEDMAFDEGRMNAVEERLSVIYKLRKKYGAATVEELLRFQETAKRRLDEIENYDIFLRDLKDTIEKTAKKMRQKADELTALRQNAASALADAVCGHLHHLGMPDAQFQIVVTPVDKYAQQGADAIAMLFSGNAGEEIHSMQKVVSGGELSRIALAIKAVCAARDRVSVMIFDEIDTGIGGRTAQMVAERISMVAMHKQVLCITHLPQIACMADCHFYIEKNVVNGKTQTNVRKLSTSGRINELARMASGSDVTPASLDNALEMLDNAKQKKETWRERFSA